MPPSNKRKFGFFTLYDKNTVLNVYKGTLNHKNAVEKGTAFFFLCFFSFSKKKKNWEFLNLTFHVWIVIFS